ncbi:MAG TPA: CoA-binding protein [Candidatus Sulfomarinibacteraceae bacterium]|nr:CoA-binding protein [Candidatus Sulfomarinibacteraceae bacterium]
MDQERKEQLIERILNRTKTIAVVGLSSKRSRAGYYVPAYLQRQGYRIIPVNPYLHDALGEKAYAELVDVPHDVDLVLLFRRSDAVPPFVTQAIEIGADAVWMQAGIINHGAAEQARAAGLDVVMDTCMMVEHRRRQ